ncbi:signal recognition particle-docking protein FtsY, partial [Fangia hongkongensis]|nr:signal recognition particle-docking protein FtsY [Fangia hongkongensis]
KVNINTEELIDEQLPHDEENDSDANLIEAEASAPQRKMDLETEAETEAETETETESFTAPVSDTQPSNDQEVAETPKEKTSLLSRLKFGLKKTRSKLSGGIGELLLGKKIIDEDLIDEIEMQLLTADVGIEATEEVMEAIRNKVSRNELQTMDALTSLLKEKLSDIITPCQQPLIIDTSKKPFVILMVGINGAGKTTTIGKLAKQFEQQGKSVILAAGDTFRAAAVEQLQVWGDRNNIPVIAQHTGADSASVIFDAVEAAKSRGIDIVIADTAGRLHTKSNLMEELKKVARVMGKLDQSAPHEVMLVLDAGTGQNAIMQAEEFNKTIPVTGIALTKMDGTAKGGVIFAIAKRLKTPIRYIGIGEKIDDLRTFQSKDFIDALFTQDKEN